MGDPWQFYRVNADCPRSQEQRNGARHHKADVSSRAIFLPIYNATADSQLGRGFSRAFPNERAKVIFNEEAIKQMGLKKPVGKLVKVWGPEKEIIGVAENFHFESFYEEVKPCLFQLEPRGHKIMVKIAAGREQETIARLQKLHRKYNQGLAFDYTLLDD